MQKKPPHKQQEVKQQDVSARINASILLPLILLLVAFVYSNSLRNNMLNFDDVEYFTNYPEILNLSWQSIKVYFTSHYVLMYQPLPVLSFALNYFFTGMNTLPMHFTNLCFHLANCILVYHFILRLRGFKGEALLITLVFGIHPMNVEAVSWISARSSGMYVFFFLLALNSYLKYLAPGKPVKQLWLTALFFLLSLFSKAQAVTFPLVMVLLDYLYGRKFTTKFLIEKASFFLLSLVFGLIALADASTRVNITDGMLVNYSLTDVVFLVTYSFSFYLIKFLLPVNLCSVYVYPPLTDGYLPFIYYLSALLFAVVVYWFIHNRRDKWMKFAAGFFLLVISINIQVIPSRLFIVTDRYGYLPNIGFMLLAAIYIARWRMQSLAKYKVNAGIVAVIYMMVLAFTSYNRNKVWANDLTLMTDIIEKNATVPYIYRAYGIRALYKVNALGDMQGGIRDYTSAIAIYPDDAKTYVNRGLTFSKMNNNAAALADLDSAITLSPERAEIYSYRAIIHYPIGKIEEAWNDCNKCIGLDSSYVDCYITRGTIAYVRKDYELSISDFTKAIKLSPDNNVAYKNRAQVYLTVDRKQEACSDLQVAAGLGNSEAFQLQQQYCRVQ